MNSAQTYAISLGQTMSKMTMTDFFHEIHTRFYPEQDISFMEYFLELTEHENEFIVHHDKLREYGIMTSTRSGAVKEKLDQLMLVEGEDYTLQDVLQRGKSGSQSHKHYYLTPGAFKICLMRAQRRANQPIDPIIYCNYYLLLEKIYKLYTDYERTYSEKLLSKKNMFIDLKDKVIYRKENTNQTLEEKLDNLTSMNKDQSEQIADLLGYARHTKATLDKVEDDLTDTKDQNAELLSNQKKMLDNQNVMMSNIDTLINLFNKTSYVPEIVKQTISLFSGNGNIMIDAQKPWEHMDRFKVFFIVFWYDRVERKLVSIVACRNFATIYDFVKDVFKQLHIWRNDRPHMEFYKVHAIAICDKNVNEEYALFESTLSEHRARKVPRRQKWFQSLGIDEHVVDDYSMNLVNTLKSRFLMRTQLGIEGILNKTNLSTDQRIQVENVKNQSIGFNKNAVEYCQLFVNGCFEYISRELKFSDHRVLMPRKSKMALAHEIEEIQSSRMNVLNYAMSMLKICIRNYSRDEFIREIVKQEIANEKDDK